MVSGKTESGKGGIVVDRQAILQIARRIVTVTIKREIKRLGQLNWRRYVNIIYVSAIGVIGSGATLELIK